MALPQRYLEKEVYTEEEYLRWEEDAETRSEFVTGEIHAMAGATEDHNTICASMTAVLWNALRGRNCRVTSSDMRVWSAGAYYYPDVIVVCGSSQYRGLGTSVITNPVLVVEVLSPSTEAKDRGEKFLRYQSVETLTAYVLVSQSAPQMELFTRREDSHWDYTAVLGLEKSLAIPSLSISLSLADIYTQIEFAEQAPDEA